MNWNRMKKNVGYRVQLVPPARRLDEGGNPLPQEDDDWMIEGVAEDGVQVLNLRTSHKTTLAKDHIYNFTSNPTRTAEQLLFGFLTLHVQIFIAPNGLSIRPNARPGEPVEPDPVHVVEKTVDYRYPFDSGLAKSLEDKGFKVRWCLLTKLSRRLDIDSWEIVIEPDEHGVLTRYRMRDRPADQVLIKKHEG